MSIAIPKKYFDMMFVETAAAPLEGEVHYGLLTKIADDSISVATVDRVLTFKLNVEELPETAIGTKIYFHIAEVETVTEGQPGKTVASVESAKSKPAKSSASGCDHQFKQQM